MGVFVFDYSLFVYLFVSKISMHRNSVQGRSLDNDSWIVQYQLMCASCKNKMGVFVFVYSWCVYL